MMLTAGSKVLLDGELVADACGVLRLRLVGLKGGKGG